MPSCPKCGKDSSKPATSWTGGAKTSRPMRVERFLCSSCGASFVAWTDPKTGAVKTMTRKR